MYSSRERLCDRLFDKPDYQLSLDLQHVRRGQKTRESTAQSYTRPAAPGARSSIQRRRARGEKKLNEYFKFNRGRITKLLCSTKPPKHGHVTIT